MCKSKRKLKQITVEILHSGDDFGRQFAACNALYRFFAGLTGINHDSTNETNATQTILDGGKAISPEEAAQCVLDFARTVQFLRGIHAAITQLKKRFPNERLEILYAGCGPFAALITPLFTQFSTEDFRVTLLDFHERSIYSVKRIITELNFDEFIADFVQTDVSRYKHAEKPHLIICETMQSALKREPQAALTLNLAPQLAENGIFIPQKITVEVCLANLSKEFSEEDAQKERIHLGEILALDAEKIRLSVFDFPTFIIDIPPHDSEKFDCMLLTKVSIFDRFELRERDSAITYPLILRELSNIKSGDRIEFKYLRGENPRFEYRLIAD